MSNGFKWLLLLRLNCIVHSMVIDDLFRCVVDDVILVFVDFVGVDISDLFVCFDIFIRIFVAGLVGWKQVYWPNGHLIMGAYIVASACCCYPIFQRSM